MPTWWPADGSFDTSPGEPHASTPPAPLAPSAPSSSAISSVCVTVGSAAKSIVSSSRPRRPMYFLLSAHWSIMWCAGNQRLVPPFSANAAIGLRRPLARATSLPT
eukprot:2688413-Prymnesium_polylepis.1